MAETTSRRFTDNRVRSGGMTVVGVGASAGGLEMCGKLLDALPAHHGMAFILVQHLDPTHESMMVALLANHTTMNVAQAEEGIWIERNHLYIIPPGAALSVGDGVLHLSPPQERHGARMPFDFLLRSLAEAYGRHAVCVILSGTGSDGTIGLAAIKNNGGYVVVQDPEEASHDGMIRSAIATGKVDAVLPVALISEDIIEYHQTLDDTVAHPSPGNVALANDPLAEIIELVRKKTGHDFRPYKSGTIRRRIERRMTMAGIKPDDDRYYVALLNGDSKQLDDLAEDLLINVTGFFRDPPVFERLAESIIPELVRARLPDQPIRVWVAGCSTGEEAYSLAMLFREQITAANCHIKMQIFASDVDPDAIARAREGLYPSTIEAVVSPARLARFFTKEGGGYRISAELRSEVVFAVQDVLSDPPFSRLDMVSCRNLLIYLRPDAQATVIALFHFALRPGGILLLGSSETPGNVAERFTVISKPERLYRHNGGGQLNDQSLSLFHAEEARLLPRPSVRPPQPRHAMLAELCHRRVLDLYAPAAVLIDRQHQCLYAFGPTDRYLRVPAGLPTHDLFSMARDGLHAKLASAIQQAERERTSVVVVGGQVHDGAHVGAFNIEVHPVTHDSEEFLLVCFVEAPTWGHGPDRPVVPEDESRLVALERELDTTRADLRDTVKQLQIASEQQKIIDEEALSINEEYQSTNEELLTSKEELQSLNEELTALNSQLHETLERQRTTFNDLQNVLYSTDVATIFLDKNLNIRLFTPATKSVFNVIPADIGRPLADLQSLAPGDTLLTDARTVLRTLTLIERETKAHSGTWYRSRILPYRTQDDQIDGVVITFADITEQKNIAMSLGEAKLEAERANLAKSRFLAAASHDLRQPLQTMVLIQGLLARVIKDSQARKLVARLDDTLSSMSSMLSTLLDINQIEAGNVRAEMEEFSIGDMLMRLRDEFSYHAQSKGLDLRVIHSSQMVHSDPRLLEQILRNLLSNAIKYTEHGKVLIGCRRRDGMLSIEICDTGVGIPQEEIRAIFEEYYQLDNAARERSRGLGLGLSIAHRLAQMLGHPIRVRSHPGKGSVFSVAVVLPQYDREHRYPLGSSLANNTPTDDGPRQGSILVIEDDPDMRELVALILSEEGHAVSTAVDGPAALALVSQGGLQPDLVMSDYNLPNGMDGLQLTSKLRAALHRDVPVIILTGDISAGTLRGIAMQKCTHLNKPVKAREMAEAVQQLLPLVMQPRPEPLPPVSEAKAEPGSPVIYVVDDDASIRMELRTMLEDEGYFAEEYVDGETFLKGYHAGREGCLLIDAYLPGMNGLQLMRRLHDNACGLPSIMITGHADVPMAVEAMKAGAYDFIEKPVRREALLDSIGRALDQARDASKQSAWHEHAVAQIGKLTKRQREIMDMVLVGHPSKNIAADIGISQRTVENHRAEIMKRTGVKSLPELARMALAAATADVSAPGNEQSVPQA